MYTRPEQRQGRSHFEQEMRRRHDLYRPGMAIPLMVNPENPAKAFCKRGRTWPLFAIAAVGGLVFLALIAALTPVIFKGP